MSNDITHIPPSDGAILSESERNSQEATNDIRVFLARFDDIERFLDRANIAVEYYFGQQTDYPTKEAFREYLKKEVIGKYRTFFQLGNHREKRRLIEQMSVIEENYDRLLFFGVFNPVEARRERLETGMTIEEQRAKRPEGLMVQFVQRVRDIF